MHGFDEARRCTVTKNGGASHVTLPGSWQGRDVLVLLLPQTTTPTPLNGHAKELTT